MRKTAKSLVMRPQYKTRVVRDRTKYTRKGRKPPPANAGGG